MNRIRRRLAVVCCALLVGALGTACTSSGSATGSKAILRIGTTGTIESLNPFVTDDTLTFDFFQAMYPFLVQYNLATAKLVPDLATSWQTTQGGKRVTFALVKGAHWSDGKPLGAADVAWTLNLMIKFKNGPSAAWAGTVAHITKVVAVNATTVQVNYNKAVSDGLAQLASIPVLPKQFWGKYATGNGKALTQVENAPTGGKPMVGGGPFVFLRYDKDQAAIFEKNPRYFGQKPHIAGFGVQFFGNDDAEVAALKGNDIDLAMGNPSLPPTDVRPIKEDGLRIYTGPSVSFDDLIINTNSKKTSHRELLNPKVREALEYATNRAQINKTVLLGYATSGASIIPPSTGVWHDPAVKPLPYDIAKANQLLDAAGDKRGSGGIRVADGHQMAYTVLVSPDVAGGLRMAQLIAQSYAKVGVKLTVKQIDDDALEDALTQNHYRDFDMAMWGWDTEYDPDYMLDAMTCQQYGDNNDSGYCNKQYDAMYAAQGVATNMAQRLKIVYAMQNKVANDRPYIVLHYLDVLEGWSRAWTTVKEGPTGFLSSFTPQSLLEVRKPG
jgi:peptide/nickel transport system substrate-binding protein